MVRAKTKKNCESCGVVFEAYHKNHRRCVRSCVKSRLIAPTECDLCGEVFLPDRPTSRYCSSRCYQIAWKRRKRGVRDEDVPFQKNCTYCGVLVPRKTTRGIAPSVCEDCYPKHRSVSGRSWASQNKDAARRLRKKLRPMMRVMLEEGVQVPRAHPLFETIEHGKQHKKFWVDLLEVCYRAWRGSKSRDIHVMISYELWDRYTYGSRRAKQSTKYRAWARWKKRLQGMGVLSHCSDPLVTDAVMLNVWVSVPVAHAVLDIDGQGYRG